MITFDSITKIGKAAWRFSWNGTGPYRIYRDGKLFLFTANTSIDVSELSDTEEPPILEVMDSTEGESETITYPHFLVLQWRGVVDATEYIIREYVGAAWIQKKRVRENGSGYYNYSTLQLADGVVSQWRVVAIDDYGNESDPLSLQSFIVRNPDAPVIDITYDSGTNDLTVASR